MSETTDLADELRPSTPTRPDRRRRRRPRPRARPSGRIPKLGVWAWSFVGFVAATIIVVIALGRGERDRAPDDVRRRARRHLQAAGRRPRTPQVQAHPRRRR